MRGRKVITERIKVRLDYLDKLPSKNKFTLGKSYTVADAYAFTVLNWGQWVGIDVKQWKNIGAYMERVAARPAVQAALKARRSRLTLTGGLDGEVCPPLLYGRKARELPDYASRGPCPQASIMASTVSSEPAKTASNRAIGQVSHPALQCPLLGFPLHPGAVTDALYASLQ